jgi:hypothetical protein
MKTVVGVPLTLYASAASPFLFNEIGKEMCYTFLDFFGISDLVHIFQSHSVNIDAIFVLPL